MNREAFFSKRGRLSGLHMGSEDHMGVSELG